MIDLIEKDGRYQLRIGRWRSGWAWPGGLADLEALKAEVEADDDKARLIDALSIPEVAEHIREER